MKTITLPYSEYLELVDQKREIDDRLRRAKESIDAGFCVEKRITQDLLTGKVYVEYRAFNSFEEYITSRTMKELRNIKKNTMKERKLFEKTPM